MILINELITKLENYRNTEWKCTQFPSAQVEAVLPGQIGRRFVLSGARQRRDAHGQQDGDALQMAAVGRLVQRIPARDAVADLRTGFGVEQLADTLVVVVDAGVVQRRHVLVVLDVHIAATIDEQLENVSGVERGGQVDGRLAGFVLGVDAAVAAPQQLGDDCQVAFSGGPVQQVAPSVASRVQWRQVFHAGPGQRSDHVRAFLHAQRDQRVKAMNDEAILC